MSDDNVTAFPTPKLVEWIVGPFEEYRVVLEGRKIPRLTAQRHEDGRVTLILDGRFGLDCANNEIAYSTADFVATALAIGQGYPCYTAETKKRPFAPKCMQIGDVDGGE